MTNIRAMLIQEERGFTASNKLLCDALEQAGFDVQKPVPAEPPAPITWKEEEFVQTVIFLGSMILGPISEERKDELIQRKLDDWDAWFKVKKVQYIAELRQKLKNGQEDTLTETEDDKLIHQLLDMLPEEKEEFIGRKKYPELWAKYIKDALNKGAGLVAMLDWSTAKVLAILDPDGTLLPIHFKKFASNLNPDVRGVIFRPILIEKGRIHEATNALVGKHLPAFGSLDRSYYRTVAQEKATVLMEIPDHVDDCAYPFLIVRKVGDKDKGPGIAILAADWCNTGGQEFVRWPHANILLSGIGRWAAGKKEEPAHWFLKSDRKYTIENWKDIVDTQGQLKEPYLVEPPSVSGAVEATLGSGQITDMSCSNAPLISETEQGAILKAKLCNGIVVHLRKVAMEAGYCLDQPAGDGVMVAKVSPASKPTYMPSPWRCAEYVEPPQVKGASLVVTYNLYSDEMKQKHTGTLHWEFTPAIKEIEGTKWACVGETFTLSDLSSDIAVTSFRSPLHRWQLGHTIDCHASYRFACYTANPKLQGFRRVQFNNATAEEGDPFHWFYGGQPFQMLTYEGGDENRTLWCYTTTPAAVRSEMCKVPDQDHIDHIELDLSVALGRQTGTVQLPTFWYCFAEQGFSHNLWLAAYDYVRQCFRQSSEQGYEIKRMYPRPTAMLRYNFTNLNELRNYADTFIPLAKELGFKRIDCGVRYVNDRFFPLHGGINALRYLCNKAHEAGIEVIFYCGASWHHDGHPSLGPNYICNAWLIKTPELKPKLWENTREGCLKGTEYHEVDGLKRRVVLVTIT